MLQTRVATRFVVFSIALLLMGCSRSTTEHANNGADSPLSAAQVLERAAATYRKMETYKASGTLMTDIDSAEMQVTIDTSFSILLKKPNQYLISWEANQPFAGTALSGTVWSDGTQPHLYLGLNNTYAKMRDDHAALTMAWGLSSGAAATIPGPFLSLSPPLGTPIYDLENPTLGTSESIAGDDCYVVSGATPYSRKETLWISKSSFLIRKCVRALEPPPGGRTASEPTTKQLEAALETTGQEITEANKQRVKDIMETAVRDSNQLAGTSVELHVEISFPKLTAKDFQFQPPEGATLTKSLLGQPFKSVLTSTDAPEQEDVQSRYSDAKLLLARGRYAEATPEYVWLWNNMAKIAPSMGAVRRSFTASDIAKLCARHEPAREQFLAIREAAGQAPLRDYETLTDFLTLCEYMGDVDVGLRWFDAHKHELPRRLSSTLRSFLRKAGRWEDIAQLDGDPIALLRQRHRWIGEYDGDSSARAREASETSLRALAGDLYAANLAAGREENATAIAQYALKIDKSPAMRKALVTTALKAQQPRAIHRTWLTAAEMKDERVTRLLERLDAALETRGN